jgi:NAD+ kinase
MPSILPVLPTIQLRSHADLTNAGSISSAPTPFSSPLAETTVNFEDLLTSPSAKTSIITRGSSRFRSTFLAQRRNNEGASAFPGDSSASKHEHDPGMDSTDTLALKELGAQLVDEPKPSPTVFRNTDTPRPQHAAPNTQELNIQTPGHHEPASESPCFVHSLLDQGASLRNWIQRNAAQSPTYASQADSSPPSDSGLGSSVHSSREAEIKTGQTEESRPQHVHQPPHTRAHGRHNLSDGDFSGSSASEYDDEEDLDDGPSLTKQLAETAVGVRELSKQLGAQCGPRYCHC